MPRRTAPARNGHKPATAKPRKPAVATPPFETPGTGLSDAEFATGIAVEHRLQARYAWDTGVAIGGYLRGLKEGKILGRTCTKCRRILVPPRMFCEQCFRPTDDWTEVRDTGTVNTFSLCYVSWDMRRLTEPEIPAVIELDGASAGIGIMHKLGNVDPKTVRTGLRVRAVWKPAEGREGSILDIEYWEPLDPAARRSAARKSTARKSTARKSTARKAPARTRAARKSTARTRAARGGKR